MTRKKRSSANRGRLSVDVGDMKDDIVHGAQQLGITVSQITRDAFRAYARREDRGVSAHDLSLLLLDLEVLAQKFVRFRDNPTDAQAAAEFQLALDWVTLSAEGLRRWMPR
jgi:hypothetical protein